MELTEKEFILLKISLMRYLNYLKETFEETKDLAILNEIENTKRLINRIIEEKGNI